MFKKEFLLPALLGLGLYAQNSELNLSNNTTMLLMLAVLLDDHQKINELTNRENRSYTDYLYERNFNPRFGMDNRYFDAYRRSMYDGFRY